MERVQRPIPPNDTTPARAKRGALSGVSRAVQPLIPNFPLSVFLNRASFPFVLISRRMALYSVAGGVYPFGIDQYPPDSERCPGSVTQLTAFI